MWWTATFEPVWTAALLDDPTPWERAVEAVDADLVARTPAALIPAARSAEDCPLPWLPFLADERSVDEFAGSWPEARRRAVVAQSFGLHQRKGTRQSMDLALRPLGFAASVVEWFEQSPRRPAYTFDLVIRIDDDREWTAADRSLVVRVANGAKNARSKLEALVLRRQVGPAILHVGGVLRVRRALRVGPMAKVTTLRPPDAILFTGAFTRRRRTLRIRERSEV